MLINVAAVSASVSVVVCESEIWIIEGSVFDRFVCSVYGIGGEVCGIGNGKCEIGDGVCEIGDGVHRIGDGVYELAEEWDALITTEYL